MILYECRSCGGDGVRPHKNSTKGCTSNHPHNHVCDACGGYGRVVAYQSAGYKLIPKSGAVVLDIQTGRRDR